ncbi:hypothetical protein G7Y89_g2687 [Cudoniella acicularis]|uniref:Xylanolytic transcriptional activator regulatory domain-containing protein n=1 Tax=Cudoniella acicularis TaxID=354080 RepID=A0A8H4RUX7_9HELO|nr:hypothetical protein G7Y89_g2687 [Cudoniella acicularis]
MGNHQNALGVRSAKNLEDRVSMLEAQLQRTDVLDDGENNLLNDDDLFAVPRAIPETEAGVGISEDSIDLEARLRQIYPVFLHPENNMRSLQDLKRAAQEDQKSPEGFASLVSQDIIRFALENTYDEITGVCPIFDLPTLNRLNAEQQAVSRTHPAGNPARWAILSTWIAMGVRFRTALGSEDEFNHVIKSYYRNAVLVLPDLILQPANMETIQALLFMAVFADGMEDHRSFVMLVTNATRQIELLALRLSGVSDSSIVTSYGRTSKEHPGRAQNYIESGSGLPAADKIPTPLTAVRLSNWDDSYETDSGEIIYYAVDPNAFYY